MLFMTRNFVNGFIQSTEDIRKWLFGVMSIRGDEATKNFKVTVYFLIRGQEITPLLECNDGAENYTWVKVSDPMTDENKLLLDDYWSMEESISVVEGEICLYAKCYK